jgi:DNA-binding HxlR family transcriptional regulator
VLDLIGDKWTLLIVRDMLLGKTHFKDFSASPERIATNILANRLSRLVTAGLVEKNRDAYRLTSRGHTLGPVVQSLATWGLKNIHGTQALLGPVGDKI